MTENKSTENQELNENKGGNGEEGKVLTPEEMAVELARLRADNAKFRNSINALTKENAEKKRLLQEKMTAEEKEAEEKREAEARAAQHTADLEKRLALYEAKARYVALGMDAAMAEETAAAEYDKDFQKITENMGKLKDAAIKNARAEWIKSRPDINAGGEDKTEDQKISDAFFGALT